MPTQLCRHIKVSGSRCQSPALIAQDYCYFHARLDRRHAAFRHNPVTRGYLIPGQHIELNPLGPRIRPDGPLHRHQRTRNWPA